MWEYFYANNIFILYIIAHLYLKLRFRQIYKNQNIILDILEYEEYILRNLSLINGVDKEKMYYRLIREYLDRLKIEYEENSKKILVLSDRGVYNLDYKER